MNRIHIKIFLIFTLLFTGFAFTEEKPKEHKCPHANSINSKNEFAECTDNFVASDKEKPAKNEFSNAGDEFSNNDEFSDNQDEFSSNDEFSDSNNEFNSTPEKIPTNWNRFYWAIGILGFVILAGIFVRVPKLRKFRPLFLLAAVVILGFYRGGPGIISSFQNTYLFIIGASNKWTAIVLFVGILPLTYIFGKVFCGWICYLGAIQQFLYISKIKLFQTEKAQKVFKIIRYIALTALIIQLTIIGRIEWSTIGPFKVIFNLYSPNITGYILLAILLVSSLFIYRPFCKAICPVGLILGWITKIPGASILGINNSCTSCKTCNTACDINAITRENKISKIDNSECVMCGDCLDDCKVTSIQTFRKGKEHNDKTILKTNK